MPLYLALRSLHMDSYWHTLRRIRQEEVAYILQKLAVMSLDNGIFSVSLEEDIEAAFRSFTENRECRDACAVADLDHTHALVA